MARVSDSLWGHRYAGAERLPRGSGRSVVRGASSPPPTTKCTAGEAAHTLGQKIYVPAYLISIIKTRSGAIP